MHYLVDPITSGRRPEVEGFVASLSPADRFNRFGNSSEEASSWLVGALAASDHYAITARAGSAVVGLLDFVVAAGSIEFGIVVDEDARGRGIARSLLAALMAGTPQTSEVIADCRVDNLPAVCLLRSTGFSVQQHAGFELHWHLDRARALARKNADAQA
jgi:ribosomal protein S18 acetylase RimI-like enzyme